MEQDDIYLEAMLMYVVIDVSQSMGEKIPRSEQDVVDFDDGKSDPEQTTTAWDAANSALQDLFTSGFRESDLHDLVKLGVIVFNDDASVHRKAWESTVNGLDVDVLPPAQGVTDFKRLFEKLTSVVTADAEIALNRRIRIKDPAIFILSDGAPYVNHAEQRPEAYRGAVQELRNLRLRRHQFPDEPVPSPAEPVVVPFGIGKSRTKALCEIVTPGYAAYQTESTAIGDVVTRVMGAILDSLTASAAHRKITVVPPGKGIKEINCPGDQHRT